MMKCNCCDNVSTYSYDDDEHLCNECSNRIYGTCEDIAQDQTFSEEEIVTILWN